MSSGTKYGDVALGVESALPAVTRPSRHRSPARHLVSWLIAALKRWA
jgi:hypothetical protein